MLFEGTLAPGEEKTFTNRHGLTFVIGNAPAVDVVVNGHDIGSPPSSGNVSRGDVTPGLATTSSRPDSPHATGLAWQGVPFGSPRHAGLRP